MSVGGVGAALYLKVRADFFFRFSRTSYSKLQVIFDGVAVCTHRMSEA